MPQVDATRLAPYVPQIVRAWPSGEPHVSVAGTLVMVDISGFTAMSERLAQKGRVGAEEVAAVLNLTFTELLTIVYERGGQMLKFGGDALTCLFPGPGHEQRATRAAAEMRAKLRSVGNVNTPAGRVKLRMSVGVHTGNHDLFLVGDTHRELVLTGPSVTRMVEMEGTADADEILLSPNTAKSLPASLVGQRKGGGFLLAKMPAPMEATALDETPAVDNLEGFIPVAWRPMLATSTDVGEHRTLTVGFVKFSGSDDLLQQEGAEAVVEALGELVAAAQDAAGQFGVAFLASDVDANGGKLILTAGVPTARGDDEERMLRAVRAVVERDHRLTLRIGVNRGTAFAGDVGAPFRRAFTVIGDAVNLAARVMAKAGPDEVLSTGSALEHSTALFDVTELEPFTVKGKSQQITAFRVGRPSGVQRSVDVDELPVIGRARELRSIGAVFEGRMPCGIVDIVGPAGIGKSRLVRQLRDAHTAIPWHFAACEQFESTTPYFPYQRLLRELLDIPLDESSTSLSDRLPPLIEGLAPDLVPWTPLVATVLDLDMAPTPETKALAPEFRVARLHEVVTELLDAALADGGGLIVEDAHWMDEASRDLTAALATTACDRTWALALARRPTGPDFDITGRLTVELGPLTAEDATELVVTALGDAALLEHQVAQLVERSGGNPLFLLELLAARDRHGDELPDSVDALVTARIDRLDPALRRLLRFASVAGATFNRSVVADAFGDLEPAARDRAAWEALDEFIVARSSGALRFRQDVFHDVAYSALPFRTRRELHRRVGEAIEARAGDSADEIAERLWVHFSSAQIYDKAWHYGVAAGDHARARFGNVEAAESYAMALQAARRLDLPAAEVASVAEQWGDCAELAGLYDQADQGFGLARRMAESAERSDWAARMMRKQGMLREKKAAYPQALRWFSRGLRRVEPEAPDSIERAELQLAYAGIRYRQAQFDQTVTWAERAMAAAEQADHLRGIAHARYLLGIAHRRLGDGEGVELLEKALPMFEELGDLIGQANVLLNLGVDAYFKGQWNRASDLYTRCREARQEAGDVVGAAMALANIALIRSDQGSIIEARSMLESAGRVFQAASNKFGVAVITSNLGLVAARSGRIEEAEQLLDQAQATLSDIGAEQYALEAEGKRLSVTLLAGRADETTRRAGALLEQLSRLPGSSELRSLAHRALGYVALSRGETQEARTWFRAALEAAQEAGSDYEIALTYEAMARLPDGGDDEDAEITAKTERLFARLGIVATQAIRLPLPV